MSSVERPVHVTSEIGNLKSVILHRPGEEVENITPDTMQDLLFDDIPYLEKAREEHDIFAETLRRRGAEVLYLEVLMNDSLQDPTVRAAFLDEMVRSSGVNPRNYDNVMSYLNDMETPSMIAKVMAGVRRNEVPGKNGGFQLSSLSGTETTPFHMAPMPNLYFTRDPAAAVGDGVTLNRMRFEARRRESLFMKYILGHNPRFASADVPVWYDREALYSMEGGDELVLSDTVAAIGISQRTSPEAIEMTAHRLFEDSSFERVIAISIPDSHAFMHLDTVFTMIDTDKFSIHPEIQQGMREMRIYLIEKDADSEELRISEEQDLQKVLAESLGLNKVTFIQCGNGDPIAAAREQWNDGSNTLAIAPGVVITYDRNYVTNQALEDGGLEVITIPGSELGRGRGGPRCMSMPIDREDTVGA